MKIFVVNCGSSSIKFQLFSMENEAVLAKGIVERVGTEEAFMKIKYSGQEFKSNIPAMDHSQGLAVVLEKLASEELGIISSIDEIQGVGHRVVHGGEDVKESVIINDSVMQVIDKNTQLAPLHNPANRMGIEAAMKAMPNVPQVAVFDTAFLSTLPEKAYRYAVPTKWYEDFGVRKYGFHGTSHRYVSLKAAELLGKPAEELNLITCHLGGGCSMTAVQNGKAIDHSMGMTPLDGLIMGTRSGTIDPAIAFYMMNQGMTADQVEKALNKESGLLGVSELSNDMRDLLGAYDEGNEKAILAIEMFVHSMVKHIGSYYTLMPSVDAIVFTGGVGENSRKFRRKVCEGLAPLGVVHAEERNQVVIRGKTGQISADNSKPPVWIIATDEELMIARDTQELVAK